MRIRLAIAGGVIGLVCTFGGNAGVGAATARHEAADACASGITYGVIPVWARSGFTGTPKMHYVLGHGRKVVGLVFAYPLSSPPPPGQGNKILWVAHTPDASGAALHLKAVRMLGTRTVGASVRRVVAGGPGPSILNLPKPGCWRLTLSWAATQDTLDVRYLAG